ncbi:MAG TPA: glycosyltransferase [Candidatus Polarisedimenticolia bacterium]|nr:glycosyltransferase [Candidatus Polarisedimenticolia bacterium]
MPRLLIVSQAFPPDAAVGAKRVRRMARHLSGLGWDVDVLTVTVSGYERLDFTLVEPDASYRVRRSFAVTPMLWGRRLRDRLWRGAKEPADTRMDGSAPKTDRTGEAGPAEGHENGPWVSLRACLTTPDEYAGWIPSAVATGLTVARPDLILASGPAWSSLMAAAAIARLRGVPLVLDYRDPWTSTAHRLDTESFRGRLERLAETRTLAQAVGLVATTKGVLESVRSLRPLPGRVVHNAYDLDLVRDIEPWTSPKFTVVYAGSFYSGRNPGPIVRALAHLKKRGMLPERGLELRVVGTSPRDVARLVAGTGLEEHVVLENLLPYREALRRVAGADVLLLVIGRNHAEMLPAKLFDYLATGRFILGIGPSPSEAADILRSSGAGVMVDPDDVPGIAAALAARFEAPRTSGSSPDCDGPYEASRTMRDLDLFLREFVAEARSRRG